MNWLALTLMAGITTFVATNVDDIVILTLFFGQVGSSRLRYHHIVVGQYLGFLVLVLASLPGFWGGMIIPPAWVGLLGFVPIVIGLKQLRDRAAHAETVQAVTDESPAVPDLASKRSTLKSFIVPQTYQVAAVTFANGGDNIGIYVPLFASSTLPSLLVILGVFFLMKGLWCAIAYQLTRQPWMAQRLTRYGHQIVPFILVGLGVFILMKNETYRLLPFSSFRFYPQSDQPYWAGLQYLGRLSNSVRW